MRIDNYVYDEPAFVAAYLLVGHTGAKELEVGYLHDGVPVEDAGWWAKAQYKGARISVEDHADPVAAVLALAEKVLTGARCQWCQGLVALRPDGAIAYPGSLMVDGSRMPSDPDELAAMGQCLWRRNGSRWEPGCVHGQSTGTKAPQNRHERRRLYREFEATRHRG